LEKLTLNLKLKLNFAINIFITKMAEENVECVEVEAVEEVVEDTPKAEVTGCTSAYVPYKSYFGTSGYHGSYLGGYGHYGGHYPYSYGGFGHSYVPHVSTYVPKVCATTVCPTTKVCETKVEEKVEEEVAEVKAECATVEMDEKVAETLRRSK
jgi:hypothetical protein